MIKILKKKLKRYNDIIHLVTHIKRVLNFAVYTELHTFEYYTFEFKAFMINATPKNKNNNVMILRASRSPCIKVMVPWLQSWHRLLG